MVLGRTVRHLVLPVDWAEMRKPHMTHAAVGVERLVKMASDYPVSLALMLTVVGLVVPVTMDRAARQVQVVERASTLLAMAAHPILAAVAVVVAALSARMVIKAGMVEFQAAAVVELIVQH